MVTIKGSIHAPASAPSPPLTASPSAGASDCDHDDRNNHDNSPPFSITSIREPTNPISAISSFNSGSKEDDKRNKDREESSPSPSPSRRRTSGEPSRPALTANLGEILKNLDLLRRGVHPALGTACDCLELPLEPLEYPLFKEYVCEPPVTPSSSLNLDLDLDSIRRWAQNKLHWDFDPDRARLIIRMATTLHQIVAKKLKDLFMERFEVAISNSTRPERGTISERGDILHTFKNPAPTLEPPVESGQQEQATQQTLPRRTAPKRDAAEPEPEPHTNASTSSDAPETKPGSEADDSEDDTSSVRKGALTEYVHCPDVGLLYTPPDREMDYFPGFILEVGYSHPLDDATAKRKYEQALDTSSPHANIVQWLRRLYTAQRWSSPIRNGFQHSVQCKSSNPRENHNYCTRISLH